MACSGAHQCTLLWHVSRAKAQKAIPQAMRRGFGEKHQSPGVVHRGKENMSIVDS